MSKRSFELFVSIGSDSKIFRASFLASSSTSASSANDARAKSGKPDCFVPKTSPGPLNRRSISDISKPSFELTKTSNLSLEDGQKAAKYCAINILAQAKKATTGNLDKIKSCIKITGFVNSTNDFVDQPKVINPASEMLAELFENKGKHSRAAVSVNSLPLGAAVEIDAIFEI